MTQKSQFLMTKGSSSMNVQPDDVATYLADGWAIVSLRYSEGGEGVDTTSLVKMSKESDSIYVRPGSVASYVTNGYQIKEIIYGADRLTVLNTLGNVDFLDVPSFASAEIGTVDATTLVVHFSTEIVADDYADGVTILVDDVEAEISSAIRQADHSVVYYAIAAVDSTAVLTWSYDDDTGGMSSEVDGSPLDDVTEAEVTNNVPAE